jgi:hypothetical protein
MNYNNQIAHVYHNWIWLAGGGGDQPDVAAALVCLCQNHSVGDMKVENFLLKIMSQQFPTPVVFALVYCPSTILLTSLQFAAGTFEDLPQLYNPPQHVTMAGILLHGSNLLVTFHSRPTRNLENGDKILFLLKAIGAIPAQVTIVADYE